MSLLKEKIEISVSFPVTFNLFYGKIYDSKNREIGAVKTLASSDETRMAIGDFIAEAMNRQYYSDRRSAAAERLVAAELDAFYKSKN